MTNNVILRPGVSIDIATATGAAASAALPVSVGTRVVRLYATTDTYVTFTGSTAAAGTALRVCPNYPEYFLITGETTISAIAASAAGVLNVTGMSA